MKEPILKNYSNIKVANDNKHYYETDGLVVSRLFLDHYGVFPNVISLKPSNKLTENTEKISYFSLDSTLTALEKNNINFNVRSVNILDNENKLSDRHYVLFFNNTKCMISIDQQHTNSDIDNYFYEIYYEDYNKDIQNIIDLIWKNSFHVDNVEVSKKIHFIVQTTSGFALEEHDIEVSDVDIEKNYNDDFKEVDKIVSDFITSKKKSDAGLLIFNGEPGTGKSYYIKNLISKYNKQFIFVTQDIVNQMSSPSFVSFLMTLKNSVLILEDCENVVSSRNAGNRSNAIANILNLCDGILSDVLNIKVIVTFNTDLKNIDSALLRKGRLKYQYLFGKLKADKACTLLKELYGDDYDTSNVKDMSLADIYNIESNNASNVIKKTIGFA